MSRFSEYKREAVFAERAMKRGIPIRWARTSEQDQQAEKMGMNIKVRINSVSTLRKVQARRIVAINGKYMQAKVRFFQAKNNLMSCEKVEATCKWVQKLKATRNKMRALQAVANELATYNIEELAERFKKAEEKI